MENKKSGNRVSFIVREKFWTLVGGTGVRWFRRDYGRSACQYFISDYAMSKRERGFASNLIVF